MPSSGQTCKVETGKHINCISTNQDYVVELLPLPPPDADAYVTLERGGPTSLVLPSLPVRGEPDVSEEDIPPPRTTGGGDRRGVDSDRGLRRLPSTHQGNR